MKKSRRTTTAPTSILAAGRPEVAARNAIDLATRIAGSVKGLSKRGHAGVNVHVHLGDVVLMGFDEAIDAEEWGMRETNHEVVGGKGRGPGKGKSRGAGLDAEARLEASRRTKRRIRLQKGPLSLEATEDASPAATRSGGASARKKSRRTGRAGAKTAGARGRASRRTVRRAKARR